MLAYEQWHQQSSPPPCARGASAPLLFVKFVSGRPVSDSWSSWHAGGARCTPACKKRSSCVVGQLLARRSLTGAVWEACAFAYFFHRSTKAHCGDVTLHATRTQGAHLYKPSTWPCHLSLCLQCRLAAAPTVLLTSCREVRGGTLTLNTNKCQLLCCVSVAAALQNSTSSYPAGGI